MVKPYDNNIGNEGEWLAFPKQYPDFKPMPNFLPERNRWYCHELMVRANTPGQSNGEVKCWIDGNLISDFPNLNMRSIDTLKIDEAHIGLHAKQSERVNKNGTTMLLSPCNMLDQWRTRHRLRRRLHQHRQNFKTFPAVY